MLKKLFAAALLFAVTATANATPIPAGINGSFDMSVEGTINVDENGSIISLLITYLAASTPNTDDFDGRWSRAANNNVAQHITETLVLDDIAGKTLFTLAGFSFDITVLRSNVGVEANGVFSNSLYLLGMFTHADFTATEAEFFVSSQALVEGENINKGFSATVTSPAPPAPAPPVEVSAPGTLAVFGLALIGFAASRRQKKSI